MANSPLIRPYLLGGWPWGGGTLGSHEKNIPPTTPPDDTQLLGCWAEVQSLRSGLVLGGCKPIRAAGRQGHMRHLVGVVGGLRVGGWVEGLRVGVLGLGGLRSGGF